MAIIKLSVENNKIVKVKKQESIVAWLKSCTETDIESVSLMIETYKNYHSFCKANGIENVEPAEFVSALIDKYAWCDHKFYGLKLKEI